MKTIKEFRERLVMGTVITTHHYVRNKNGQMILNRTFVNQVVIDNDRNAFRLRINDTTTNWMHWPMREFFKPIDEQSIAIETQAVRIEIIITGSVLSS